MERIDPIGRRDGRDSMEIYRVMAAGREPESERRREARERAQAKRAKADETDAAKGAAAASEPVHRLDVRA